NTLEAVDGEWYLVHTDDLKVGFVHSSCVAFGESDDWREGKYVQSVPVDADPATARTIWDYCKSKGLTDEGAAALMGNLYCESLLKSNNLEDWAQKYLGYLDEEYTAAIDNGTYTEDDFTDDYVGYGLAQWTLGSRKEGLYELAKERKVSIADVTMQMDYLWSEFNISYYSHVLRALETATDIKYASDLFMTDFENPANQYNSAKKTRYSRALTFYEMFAQSPLARGNAYVNTGKTFGYLSPDVSSPKVALLKSGAPVTILFTEGEWARTDSGMWIHLIDLTLR
ncbi:MAG: hypothetical protein HUJ69_08705, partial [Lachnospiraceae bacterium]|nr:hypothetical protein [Lachnospiraceae bacterium]